MKTKIFALFFTLATATVGFSQGNRLAQDLFNEALEHQMLHEWYAAIELYQESVQKNPNYAMAWMGLAECSYSLGEFSLAVEYADKAMPYMKNNAELMNLKGFALIGKNDLAGAKEMFTKVLASYPNDVDARFGLAELDIYEGKITSAEQVFLSALSRQSENKRALLSLSILAYEQGKKDLAQKYISDALHFHGNSPDVHYFAAYIAVGNGDMYHGETHAHKALRLAPDYDKAKELLSFILYTNGNYEDVLTLCDERIVRNPTSGAAWYLKGVAFQALNRIDEAITSYRVGLRYSPEDEIMRSALEQLIFAELDIEDDRRKEWAVYHGKKAKSHSRKFSSSIARYEYKKAITLDPNNVEIRKEYANLLLKQGLSERCFAQLKFLKESGVTDQRILDQYDSFVAKNNSSISAQWGIDPLFMDKIRYKLMFFHIKNDIQTLHPMANQITANALADVANSEAPVDAVAHSEAVSGYAEAFNIARNSGQDFFSIIRLDENDRELTIYADLYLARTGARANSFKIYRTGNERFTNATRKIIQMMCLTLQQRGKLVQRNGSVGLVDLGKADGVAKGDVFHIIRKGVQMLSDTNTSLTYRAEDIFGTITITEVGDDLSVGNIKISGFNDFINSDDQILPEKPKPLIVITAAEAEESVAGEENAGGEGPAMPISTPKLMFFPVENRVPSLIDVMKNINHR